MDPRVYEPRVANCSLYASRLATANRCDKELAA